MRRGFLSFFLRNNSLSEAARREPPERLVAALRGSDKDSVGTPGLGKQWSCLHSPQMSWCYGLNDKSPQDVYVEALTINMMSIWSGEWGCIWVIIRFR